MGGGSNKRRSSLGCALAAIALWGASCGQDGGAVAAQDAVDAAPSAPDASLPPADTSAPDASLPPADTPGPEPCNGSTALCERSYADLAYLTTHNAMANPEDGFFLPNQRHGLARQLADGVRALMLDLHDWNGETYLCHGECGILGNKPLVDAFREIATFLETHPREVVTLLFESYVTGDAVLGALQHSGLAETLYPHVVDTPWPTLGEMIANDQRLVLLTDRDGGAFPGYVDVWDVAFETHWAAETAADFSCRANRGSPQHPLFILNHFLTNPLPHKDFAAEVNTFAVLHERAVACGAEHGRLPNFVTVDFYSIGDAAAVVDALNGI